MNENRAVTVTLFLLRVVIGWLFIQHGSMKLFQWWGGMPGGFHAPLMSQVGIAGILEFFGGILIMLGLFTRPVAFILSGEMAVAYWQMHFPKGTWPLQNGGEPAVLACFVFLYFAARGAGAWSLDAVLARRRRAGPAAEARPAAAPSRA
jgi:putative oxidoreductase